MFRMSSLRLRILKGSKSPAGGLRDPDDVGLTILFGKKSTMPATPTAYPPFTVFITRPLTTPRRACMALISRHTPSSLSSSSRCELDSSISPIGFWTWRTIRRS